MSENSPIEWTNATWNPVTGCDRISPGCDYCYALTLAKRLKSMGAAKYQNDGDPRTSGPGFAVTTHPDSLTIPARWRKPRLVFVNSMSDLFHAHVPTAFIQDVFDVITDTPQHTYQLLTKRPLRARRLAERLQWPANLWLGVSVENTDHLGRVGELLHIPAALRFLSCEPLLGDLTGLDLTAIDWVIAGGESGHGHRPLDLDWVRRIRDLSVSESVPFFFKQVGGTRPTSGGRLLDDRTWDQIPTHHHKTVTAGNFA